MYEIALAWHRTAEPARDPLNEADLSLIWQGQRFPPEALQTADGRAVAVVNPGRRGGGSGPDFLDAVVLLDGVERRGDVELHVRASSFRGHGHDRDPAYCNLALHVVYQADERETRLSNGALAPVAAFAPWLEGRAGELSSWMQAPEIWQQPCRDAVERLGEAAVRAALEAAGGRRFEARVERMASDIERLGGEEALWRALLDTLGVGGDREGFRRLAAAFPAALAAQVRAVDAALVYVAGLGPAPEDEAGLPSPLSPALESFGRPANRPGLRLAGLAAVMTRAIGQVEANSEASRQLMGQSGIRAIGQRDGPLSDYALASVVERGVDPGTMGSGNQASAAGAVVRGVDPGTMEPGNQGAAAGSAVRGLRESAKRVVSAWMAPPQIGEARARELVVNAVLPFAAAHGLGQEAVALLRALPAGESYGKTAFLASNLRPAKGRIARSALQSQGLLGYVAEWCSQGGCGRCPLSRA